MVLCNCYAIGVLKYLLHHKAIEYVIKSKTESPTTRLKTLLLKLSEYSIDLKYQKGSEMHTSDALSRLQNITTPLTTKMLFHQISYNVLHLIILNMHIHI